MVGKPSFEKSGYEGETMENICKFPGSEYVDNSIEVLNFVRENQPPVRERKFSPAAYVLHLVLEGEGMLRCGETQYRLQSGTVFLTRPAMAFSLLSSADFRYAYVTFIGLGVPALLSTLRLSPACSVATGHSNLIPFWLQTLMQTTPENYCLLSRSVLFYTLADIGTPNEKHTASAPNFTMRQILRRLEDQYFDTALSLNKLCKDLNYNQKYISHAFKQAMGMSFSEYLRALRVRHACALMEERSIAIKEIAAAVGFQDPLYFSKVFKEVTSYSPRQYQQIQHKERI